jgi:hypothetical protein
MNVLLKYLESSLERSYKAIDLTEAFLYRITPELSLLQCRGDGATRKAWGITRLARNQLCLSYNRSAVIFGHVPNGGMFNSDFGAA